MYLEVSDPIGIGDSDASIFYAHKIEDLLVDLALGMTSSKKWDGTYKVNAGHLIVTKQGQVVCLLFDKWGYLPRVFVLQYKIRSWFKGHQNHGTIRRDGSGVFLELNLQIRFIK